MNIREDIYVGHLFCSLPDAQLSLQKSPGILKPCAAVVVFFLFKKTRFIVEIDYPPHSVFPNHGDHNPLHSVVLQDLVTVVLATDFLMLCQQLWLASLGARWPAML